MICVSLHNCAFVLFSKICFLFPPVVDSVFAVTRTNTQIHTLTNVCAYTHTGNEPCHFLFLSEVEEIFDPSPGSGCSNKKREVTIQ